MYIRFVKSVMVMANFIAALHLIRKKKASSVCRQSTENYSFGTFDYSHSITSDYNGKALFNYDLLISL